MEKFIVRYSERQTAWIEIASFNDLGDAEKEFNNQILEDQKENNQKNKTQIIDSSQKVIKEFTGKEY